MPKKIHPLTLPAIALSLMTVISAVAGLNVALPSIARDLGATQTQLTWIVDVKPCDVLTQYSCKVRLPPHGALAQT